MIWFVFRGSHLLDELDFEFFSIGTLQKHRALIYPKVYGIVYNPIRFVAEFPCRVRNKVGQVIALNLKDVQQAWNRSRNGTNDGDAPVYVLNLNI